jgi:RHS repeat-associated protein
VHTRQVAGENVEIVHYADGTDAPGWTQKAGVIEREIADGRGQLAAIRSGSQTKLQISDLHGDVIAEVPNQANPPRPTELPHQDVFGVPPALPATPQIQGLASRNFGLDWPDSQINLERPDVQPGDLLLTEVFADDGATVAMPPGWTPVEGGSMEVGPSSIHVFSRVVGPGDPVVYSIEFSVPGWHHAGMKAFRGLDPARPLTATTTPELGIPSITPEAQNSWISVFNGADFSSVDYVSPWLWMENPPENSFVYANSAITDGGDGSYGATSVYSSNVGPLSAGVGTPVHWMGYDFGAQLQGSGTITVEMAPPAGPPLPSGTGNRYRFQGAKQRATATVTGAITMGARVYLPQLGRFLQVDPVYGGSANPYDYAFQDPVNVFDPDGKSSTVCEWIAKVLICTVLGGAGGKPDPDDHPLHPPHRPPEEEPVGGGKKPPSGGAKFLPPPKRPPRKFLSPDARDRNVAAERSRRIQQVA